MEGTFCADVEGDGCEEDLEGDNTGVLADLEGGGPDGVLLGDALDFALSVEEIPPFLIAD